MPRMFRASHLLSSLSIAALVLVSSNAFAQDTDDDDSGVKLAPSVERLAGVSYLTLKPENSSTANASFVTLGGAIHNPLSMPRVGFDVYLPNGLGFGAALGFSAISPSSTSQSGRTSDGGTLSAFVLSPRIGYRIGLSPYFDLVPRLGVTFMGGSLTEADGQSCTGGSTGTTTCTSIPGTKDSVSAVALSPEVLGVVRLTSSFNLIAGLGYDHVLSASAKETRTRSDGSTASESNDAKGTFSSLHLWFGMGGYL